jgi:hypothetical protein
MKWNKGIVRLWIALSVLWVGFVIWRSDLACDVKTAIGINALWCQFELVDPAHYYTALAVRALIVPVLVALAISAVIWVIAGFRRRQSRSR